VAGRLLLRRIQRIGPARCPVRGRRWEDGQIDRVLSQKDWCELASRANPVLREEGRTKGVLEGASWGEAPNGDDRGPDPDQEKRRRDRMCQKVTYITYKDDRRGFLAFTDRADDWSNILCIHDTYHGYVQALNSIDHRPPASRRIFTMSACPSRVARSTAVFISSFMLTSAPELINISTHSLRPSIAAACRGAQ
jgi:hypothetical protein